MNNLKIFFDKIGYLFLIVCCVIMFFTYANYLLFETNYLLSGEKITLPIKNKKIVGDKFIYEFELQNSIKNSILISQPTKKNIEVGAFVDGHTAPYFNKFIFGNFIFASYTVGIVLIIIGLFTVFVSFCMLLNVNNLLTRKVKMLNSKKVTNA